jgi:cell division protein FtsB
MSELMVQGGRAAGSGPGPVKLGGRLPVSGAPRTRELAADAVGLLGTLLRDHRVVARALRDCRPSDAWVIQRLLVASGLLGVVLDRPPAEWTSDTVEAGLLGAVLADPARAEATVRRLWPQLPAPARPRCADPSRVRRVVGARGVSRPLDRHDGILRCVAPTGTFALEGADEAVMMIQPFWILHVTNFEDSRIAVARAAALYDGIRGGASLHSGTRVHYASALELNASKGVAGILRTVHSWLSVDRREEIEFESLSRNGASALPSGARVEVLFADSESPYLHAIRYSHPDTTVPGRRWVTEVGLRAYEGADAIHTSIVTATEDISSAPTAVVVPTRPRLVTQLLAKNGPALSTPGMRIDRLTLEDANDFVRHARDMRRKYPIIVISSIPGGEALIDPRTLLRLVQGIADVVLIDGLVDTRKLADVVGAELIPFAGGVRIAYPVSAGPYSDHVPVRTIRPVDLDDWRIAGVRAEQEIFAGVAHRTARGNLTRHLALEQVREEQIRRRVARARAKGVAEASTALYEASSEVQARYAAREQSLQQDIEVYDQMLIERDQKIAELGREIDELEIQNENDKQELWTAQTKLKAHEATIAQLTERPSTSGADKIDGKTRDALRALLGGRGTVADALRAVAFAHRDRVVVLPSAYRSAEASAGFRRADVVTDLLCKLLGTYHETLTSGGTTAQAKAVFGDAFSSTESDTVANNPMGRKRRTFTYQGVDLEMMSHLKHGRKESPAETLRIHFHWDADARLIVIGHCGRHLDFN